MCFKCFVRADCSSGASGAFLFWGAASTAQARVTQVRQSQKVAKGGGRGRGGERAGRGGVRGPAHHISPPQPRDDAPRGLLPSAGPLVVFYCVPTSSNNGLVKLIDKIYVPYNLRQ